MKRRDFLKSSVYSSAAVGAGAGMAWSMPGFAAHAGIPVPRTLVNVMLLGGADLRFAIAPAPTHDALYLEKFWAARKSIYTQNYVDYATMFANEFQAVTDPATGFSFGIHKSCGWLVEQFNTGNVAIVANAYGSLNRRHDHSQIIVNSGDPSATQLDLDREGWGGRLVETSLGGPNVVAINSSVSMFARGSDPADRLAQVIHGKNMRNMALPVEDPNLSVTHHRNVATRALMAYYKQRGIEIDVEKSGSWPYRRFFQHNESIRLFGGLIADRLAQHPHPAGLAGLDLYNNHFEHQCHNLYDCCLTPDILDMKVISMDIGGWDSHVNEQASLNRALADVFGSLGGLATVHNHLSTDVPGANDNLLYLFTSDFGRQIAANGSRGTDHGRGSYSIMIGQGVNGGIRGEMFPQREALPDPADSQGRAPLQIPGRDINGLTSIERIYSHACDWVSPGSGSVVFPGASGSAVEAGVDLSGLFTA